MSCKAHKKYEWSIEEFRKVLDDAVEEAENFPEEYLQKYFQMSRGDRLSLDTVDPMRVYVQALVNVRDNVWEPRFSHGPVADVPQQDCDMI